MGGRRAQEGTKAALAEQLRKGSELSRKMSTLEELSSDDDLGALSDSTEASDFDDEREANLEAGDGEEGEGNKKLNKADKGIAAARRRAEAVLAGIDDEAAEEPQGLFALPFMARALSKQRQQSQREASQLLEELDRAERQQARDSSDEQVREAAHRSLTAVAALTELNGPSPVGSAQMQTSRAHALWAEHFSALAQQEKI